MAEVREQKKYFIFLFFDGPHVFILNSLYAATSLFHMGLKEWSTHPCLYSISCQALSNKGSQDSETRQQQGYLGALY